MIKILLFLTKNDTEPLVDRALSGPCIGRWMGPQAGLGGPDPRVGLDFKMTPQAEAQGLRSEPNQTGPTPQAVNKLQAAHGPRAIFKLLIILFFVSGFNIRHKNPYIYIDYRKI